MFKLQVQVKSLSYLRSISISREKSVLDLKTLLKSEFDDVQEVSIQEIMLSFGSLMEDNNLLMDYLLEDDSVVELRVIPSTASMFCGGCKEGFRMEIPSKRPILLQCGDSVCAGCYYRDDIDMEGQEIVKYTIAQNGDNSSSNATQSNGSINSPQRPAAGNENLACITCPYEHCGQVSYRPRCTKSMLALMSSAGVKRNVRSLDSISVKNVNGWS